MTEASYLLHQRKLQKLPSRKEQEKITPFGETFVFQLQSFNLGKPRAKCPRYFSINLKEIGKENRRVRGVCNCYNCTSNWVRRVRERIIFMFTAVSNWSWLCQKLWSIDYGAFIFYCVLYLFVWIKNFFSREYLFRSSDFWKYYFRSVNYKLISFEIFWTFFGWKYPLRPSNGNLDNSFATHLASKT